MAASLNDWRFQGYLYKMVLVFLGNEGVFIFQGGGGEWRGSCGSLITTSFLERIFFRHFYGVVQ